MVQEMKKLILKDYQDLLALNIPITLNVKKLLFPQTILGHIQAGHTYFLKHQEINFLMEDVFLALGIDPNEAKIKRETLIYDFKNCLEDLMDGKINKLVDRKGKPVFGNQFLEEIFFDGSREEFKGVVLAGRMDSDYWRRKTVEKYKKNFAGEELKIGSGQEFLVNTKILDQNGFWFKSMLSCEGHSYEDIEDLKEIGLIVGKENANKKGIESMFIRTNSGLGCCDDASIISIGLRHCPNAMILGWGIDATDTYTKFVKNPKEGGYDEWLAELEGKRWRRKYKEELVTPEETTEIIYLGTKNNFPWINMSSSHRRFDQIEKGQKFPTIINHYNFVKYGKIPKNYQLSFDRMPSELFYEKILQRHQLIEEKEIFKEKKIITKRYQLIEEKEIFKEKKKIPRKIKKEMKKIGTWHLFSEKTTEQ